MAGNPTYKAVGPQFHEIALRSEEEAEVCLQRIIIAALLSSGDKVIVSSTRVKYGKIARSTSLASAPL